MTGVPGVTSALLEVRDLEVAHRAQQVLWGISFEVRAGEVVAVVGPNGAGKTTTLLTIAGLVRPLRGAISFMGRRLDGLAPNAVVDRGIVLVPEGRRLFGTMSVLENLLLGGFAPRARRERANRLEQVMELFPVLASRHRQRASTLSGGEQQMLAIGRALMARPQLLLLDEPSLGLAPRLIRQVFGFIRQIASQDVTVVVVEQNVAHALAHADRGYVMSSGRLVAEGAAAELLTRDEIRRTYVGI